MLRGLEGRSGLEKPLPPLEISVQVNVDIRKRLLIPAVEEFGCGGHLLKGSVEIEVHVRREVRPIGPYIQGEKGKGGPTRGVRLTRDRGRCVVLDGPHDLASNCPVVPRQAVKNKAPGTGRRTSLERYQIARIEPTE